jgi:hypothetical protein
MHGAWSPWFPPPGRGDLAGNSIPRPIRPCQPSPPSVSSSTHQDSGDDGNTFFWCFWKNCWFKTKSMAFSKQSHALTWMIYDDLGIPPKKRNTSWSCDSLCMTLASDSFHSVNLLLTSPSQRKNFWRHTWHGCAHVNMFTHFGGLVERKNGPKDATTPKSKLRAVRYPIFIHFPYC